MAQLRFVGLTEDLTQEIHLLMLGATTQPKIVSGMNATVQRIANTLYLVISPGTFIMPDGMIVKETSQISIPLIPPTTNQSYDVTVIAYRSTDPGIMNDEVFYEIISGEQYSATIGNIISTTNKVFMPISWINYDYDTQTYTSTNLGDRASDNSVVLKAPFESFIGNSAIATVNVDTKVIPVDYKITVHGAPTFTEDLSVYNITTSSTLLRVTSTSPQSGEYNVNIAKGIYTFNPDDIGDEVKITYITNRGRQTRLIDNDLIDSLRTSSKFYFRVFASPNEFIESIDFNGKSEDNPEASESLGEVVSTSVSIKSLMNSNSLLNRQYRFSTTSFETKSLSYPEDSHMNEDLLEITISGGSVFYLKTITINKTRIF